mgnify:CR=1 FL=1
MNHLQNENPQKHIAFEDFFIVQGASLKAPNCLLF